MTLKKLIPWNKDKKEKDKETQLEVKEKYISPRDYFMDIQRRFDEIFEEFAFNFGFPSLSESKFYPKIDVREDERNLVIYAEVPGLDEKNLDISITKDSLILSGEKKTEYEDKSPNYYKKEISYGNFKRIIPLPVEVDESKAEAKYKNGVISILIPKLHKEEKKVKKIPIKSE